MAKNSIQTFQDDISHSLRLLKPNLPLFIYGHSMGALTVTSFLINNPNLNIAGVILSAPFFAFTKESKMDDVKRILIRTLAPELDNIVNNPMIPVHLVCSDRRIYYQFLNDRKFIPFLSMGLV
jgi:alpha-beta hydrolase superfamily lysophospholipase